MAHFSSVGVSIITCAYTCPVFWPNIEGGIARFWLFWSVLYIVLYTKVNYSRWLGCLFSPTSSGSKKQIFS